MDGRHRQAGASARDSARCLLAKALAVEAIDGTWVRLTAGFKVLGLYVVSVSWFAVLSLDVARFHCISVENRDIWC